MTKIPRVQVQFFEPISVTASEYRSFFLYYLVPCLSDILGSPYLQHAILLARGVHLLTKSVITESDLLEADQCFTEFVALMDTLYG